MINVHEYSKLSVQGQDACFGHVVNSSIVASIDRMLVTIAGRSKNQTETKCAEEKKNVSVSIFTEHIHFCVTCSGFIVAG